MYDKSSATWEERDDTKHNKGYYDKPTANILLTRQN